MAKSPPSWIAPSTTRPTLIVMTASYILVLVAVVMSGWVGTERHFTYALDDAYIHLSMARNLADFGVFGPTRLAYESASSSPFWTVTLAGVLRLVPLTVGVYAPLLLAAASGIGVLAIFASCQEYIKVQPGRPGMFLAALLVPIALFLPGLVVGGMEAATSVLAALLLALLFQRHVEGSLGRAGLGVLLGLSLLAPLIRFEALFVIAGCVVAALVVPPLSRRGRPRVSVSPLSPLTLALIMSALAWVGVSAFAAVNLAHGQYALPNSVMAKSDAGQTIPIFIRLVLVRLQGNLLEDGLLTPLLGFVIYRLLHDVRARRYTELPIAVTFVVATVLHEMLADTGGFFRYQAYLVALGLLLAFRSAAQIRLDNNRAGGWQMMGGIVVISAFAFALPRFYFTAMTPVAMQNIYQQQAQVGAFFATQYQGRTVACDDIGEVSFQHQGPLLDLRGLGSFQVLKALKERRYGKAFLESEARKEEVRAICIHVPIIGPVVPKSWVMVAELTEPSANIVMISPTAIFYAIDEVTAAELRQNLQVFQPRLPRGVTIHYEPARRG